MDMLGKDVKDPNFLFRFCLIIFVGIIVAGIVLSWKYEFISASDYQDLPTTHQELSVKKENDIKKQRTSTLLPNLNGDSQ